MVGGPVASLNWLEKHLLDHSLKLSSGDIVLGGTALGLYPVQVDDHIEVKLDGQLAVHCKVKNSVR
jgi:2-keto-4-pentenoate hydratase